uniref:Uncharacterized protein n=1 Tax=Setaria digitata TaxID=48799 RepID=A0A915Q079_9BILA
MAGNDGDKEDSDVDSDDKDGNGNDDNDDDEDGIFVGKDEYVLNQQSLVREFRHSGAIFPEDFVTSAQSSGGFCHFSSAFPELLLFWCNLPREFATSISFINNM